MKRLDVGIERWITDAVKDVGYAVRSFRRSPGFALTTVLTLALGIGANTTVFSIADAVLLKMLPVPEPKQLIQILEPILLIDRLPGSGYFDRFTFTAYQEVQRLSAPFGDVVAESMPSTSTAIIDGTEEPIRYSAVSGNYFSSLCVKAALGRVLAPSVDNEVGQHPEAVISYAFWRRRFASDARIIGRTIRFDYTQFQITGVAERGFFGLQVGSMADVWVPATMEKRDLRRSTFLRLIERLRPGASATQALAPLQVWHRRTLLDRFATSPPESKAGFFARTAQVKAVSAARGMSPFREQYADPIRVVFAIVAAILLLVCANVANVLLARASAREKEIAIRKSLGAGRMRLVRQLLTESLVLTVTAAAVGLLVVHWTAPALVAMLAPSNTPVRLALETDRRILAFLCALALVTAVGCGIFPAMRASETHMHSVVRSGAGIAGRRMWHSKVLVALQTGLSVVLLIISALFVRTLLNLKSLDPGFNRNNVVIATVLYGGAAKDEQLSLAWQELLRRITVIPGVESASTAIGGPLLRARRNGTLRIANAPLDDTLPSSWFLPISANYFRTFGGSLITGRDFEPRDFYPSAPAVAIINETMARRFFGNINPIGQKLNDSGLNSTQTAETIDVVGVASDMKFDSLRTAAPAVIYLPLTQHGSRLKLSLNAMALAVRSRRDSGSVIPAIRRELATIDPRFVMRDITTQEKLVDESLLRERLLATVGSFFGLLALVLAGIGVYGTMSYSVTQRTQELAIRMALGARQGQILWMILREALVMAAIGASVGVGVAFFAARLLATLLFGLTANDPSTLALSLGMLTVTSLIAALVPGMRTRRMSLVNALRVD